VSAASGWRTDFAIENVLDNRRWRDRVLELCQLIGYILPETDWDEAGKPGSYYASHAEKKLVAYYIDEHVPLPSISSEGASIYQPAERSQTDLPPLATLCPRVPTVRAGIQVSSPVCEDCESFMAHIKDVFGVSFTVEHF
jgi:hypothetical protein